MLSTDVQNQKEINYSKQVPEYTYVFYHYPCTDGFMGAYLYWKVLGDQNTKYVGLTYTGKQKGNYNFDFNKLNKEDKILFVDFAPCKKVLTELMGKVSVLHIVDHHKTAIDEITTMHEFLFAHPTCEYKEYFSLDNTKSGASLAFILLDRHLFYTKGMTKMKYLDLSFLSELVADRDLWLWEQAETASVTEALMSYPFDFQVWDKLNIDLLLSEGDILLRSKTNHLKLIKGNARKIRVGVDYTAVLVNSSVFMSELGNELLKERFKDVDFAIVWVEDNEGNCRCSLRSIGDFNVSKIAQYYGGGGHKNSAGCTVSSINDFYMYAGDREKTGV